MHLEKWGTQEWRDKQRAKEYRRQKRIARKTGNVACLMGPADFDKPILVLDDGDSELLHSDPARFRALEVELFGGEPGSNEVLNQYVVPPFLPLPTGEASAGDVALSDGKD